MLAHTGAMPDWWRTPTGERGAAVIAGVLFNQKRFIESGIVYNRGVIPNLPAELGVEVPIVADAAGIHPLSLGPMPDPIAKLLTVQANVQQLAVDAAVHGSKKRALQALLIDPVINQFHHRRSEDPGRAVGGEPSLHQAVRLGKRVNP